MPAIDLLKQPFLPPEHEATLAPLQAVLHTLELPSAYELPLKPQITTVQQVLYGNNREVKGWCRQSPKEPTTPEQLERNFQAHALAITSSDTQFEIINRLAIIGAAAAKSKGNESDVARAYSAGQASIDLRARNAASTVLRSFDQLFVDYPEAGLDRSAYARTDEAFNKDIVECPVIIYDEDWQELSALSDRAVSVSMRGRLQLAHKLQIFRAMRLADLKSSTGPLGLMLHTTDMMTSPPIELNDGEIARTMRTASRYLRLLGFAAIGDRSLANDPTVRHFAYVTSRLRAHDRKSETANFDKRVEKMVRRKHKAAQQQRPR